MMTLKRLLLQLKEAFDPADPALDYGDCIEVAYAVVNSTGKHLSCRRR